MPEIRSKILNFEISAIPKRLYRMSSCESSRSITKEQVSSSSIDEIDMFPHVLSKIAPAGQEYVETKHLDFILSFSASTLSFSDFSFQ